MDLTPEEVLRLVPEVTPDQAVALAEWYSAIARGLAAFPRADLKRAEPALRSTPGPA